MAEPRSGGGFSSDRQQLLRLLLRDKGVKAASGQEPIPRRRDREAPARLSFAQQRLWVIDRLAPGSAAYNIPVAYRLSGRLDARALLAAMTEVVRRHEALRTTFGERDGTPFQIVLPSPSRVGTVADLSTLPTREQDPEVRRLAEEEAARPFDLERGPLVRLTLLRLGGDEHALLLTMHHIVSDGWSAGVFVREMTALYQAFVQGLASPLPELAIQYPDFAEWQRSWLSGDRLAEQLRFWRDQLAGAPPALDLPTDRPRLAKPDGYVDRGGVRHFTIDQDLTGALNALCRREGATLFMALLAAFGTVLGRHAGQPDLVVGSPIANRNRAEIEGLIGFFVNSLALRVDLRDDPPFGELLARVRAGANGAYAHQDLPFERLVEELHPERELGRNPVFQVMLALQNVPPPNADDVYDLTLEPLTAETGAVHLDLTVDIYERDGGLTGRIGYAVELFDAPTVDRLAVHLGTFLAEAAASPGLRVSELPLLSIAERHQALAEWNDSRMTPSIPVPAHCLLEARPADAVAVVFHDRQLTFGELVRRAKRLAAHLRTLGVGPEVRVGVCVERSPEAIIAVFAVLEAGGAYVPLDPQYPQDRLRYLLDDSRTAVLVGRGPILRRLPELAVPTVDLDAFPFSGEGGMVESPAPPHPETAAYVIYTSGSTGRPKGVVGTHRGLANSALAWTHAYVRRTRTRCHLQTAGLSFDVFTADLFNGLCCGGVRLVICPAEMVPSPPDTYELMLREGVDYIDVVPALIKGLLEHADAIGASLDFLRFMVIGADIWPVGDRDHAARVCGPGTRLINVYGVTESTVDSCIFEASEGSRSAGSLVPIGRPLPNTRLHLLDRSLQPVPVGTEGELCIAGLSLGRGYLDRAALTADRWVPDAFSSSAEEPGMRLYRTGDRARRLADGTIEFLGRLDHQVKVRGVRIEPGEIEAALRAHPQVRDAAVVVPEEPGARRLVAWVVAENPFDLSSLRGFLRQTLPDTLIPALFLSLDALPLTPNRKVDRLALSRRPVERPERDDHVAPRNPMEEMLAGLWSELLDIETVGAHDDFFGLGGHSLLATQAVSRVRQVFGVDLPLRVMFEAPTLEAFAARIDAARRQARGLVAPPIVPAPRPAVPEESDLPLSFAQERLWLFDRMQPGLPVYNVPDVRRWNGPLRIDLLARALDAIVERHEALRTRIGTSAAGPVQVIEPRLAVPVPVVDLQALPETTREAEAARQAEVETWRPFDLARGPVLRVCVVRLAPDDHVIVLTRHHIASDGWSMDIFSRELAMLYGALLQGILPVLPPLPVQYADFAVWQRRWLSGAVLEEQLGWWRERLAGAPAVLQLPTDRPRPAVQSFHGAIVAQPLPAAQARAVEELCRREGVTAFMTVLAAWDALLSRYGAGIDLVVGSPIANRHRLEVEGLIGFFANVLVLRTDLAGDPTVRELLGRVRETALGAYERQDTPFEKLVEELRPERSLSHTPLFQVLFAFNEMRGDEPSDGNEPALSSRRLGGLKAAMSRYDLELYAFRGDSYLELAVEYRTDLFDATRISRMLGHLSALLAEMTENPGRPLSHLAFLSKPERHQLLFEWGSGPVLTLGEATLLDRFEAQAARTPGAVALIYGEERRTYGDLYRDAGRLADRLRSLGVGPEVRVGLCLERTARLVEAMLAVLLAGGAYVPLDPAYPAERLAFMVEDSGMAVLVTEEPLVGKLSLPGPVHLVFLDGVDEHGGLLVEASPPGPAPGNLAYVLYTSGSTGRPKAVAVEHRSAAALIAWAGEVFTTAELEGVLAGTSIAFDLSVFELFVPLSYGGRVILAPDALHLPSLPAAREVKLINTVPSVLAELLRLDGLPPSVRVVNLAGEPLPVRLAVEAYSRPSIERVLNLYGPSEDTTYSTWSEVPRDLERGPTIGRSIAGTQVYLLDAASRPVPAGVDGELCLGGVGLARGYLGRPALTAERFVPDPLGPPGGRLYRTGDLARYRADGEIEFVGRIDHQVKVRGFRIELGEVEAALRRHPAVRDAAVVVHQDEGGDRRLVACWVPRHPEDEVSTAGFRAFLQEHLPEAMLPSAFLELPALPLTPNGKVDRQALARLDPRPARDRSTERAGILGAGEELIADIWREVLGLPEIGTDESFFTLGGHSLLATRVTSRLREVFGVELPVRVLFEAPTVRRLAAVVEEARASRGEGLVVPPIRPVPRDRPLPLSFAQERLWFLDRLVPDGSMYNMPMALRAVPSSGGRALVPALLDAVLSEVVRRHEALRTTFDDASGRPVQLISPAAPIRLPLIDLSGLPGAITRAEVERLASEEAQRQFDLRRGPLLRGALLALENEHVILLNQHHIVSDGWSLGVLMGEISALYRAALAGAPSPLPELPIQYADFAVWQREQLGEAGIERQLAFWRERLAGAPVTLALPSDRPRPAVQSFRGAQLGFSIGPEPTRGLRRLGRRRGATLFMTLLGGLAVLLQRLSSQDDLVVGTPIANRNHLATERLIGVFVNSLGLRQDLANDPAIAVLLERERETALAAYAHQDLPFERLVEELRPERRLSHHPIFQVMFALQNATAGALDLPGLTLEPLDANVVTAKLDLELHVHEVMGAEGEILSGTLAYATDLFDDSTAWRLVRQLGTVLEGLAAAVDDPARRISSLPLLTGPERHQIAREWNDTARERLPDVTLHGLVEAQARLRPDAVALLDDGEALSYGELILRAGRLARVLAGRGVGLEARVGICLPNVFDRVVALLAVLRAGGAWVPLDPTYPAERLAFLAADSGIEVLLTLRDLAGRVSGVPTVLLLDGPLPAADAPVPSPSIEPEHPAYLIYTSGSTGRPNGVVIMHGAAVSFVVHGSGMAGLSPGARLPHLASFGFDASVLEIFLTLANGGTLIRVPEEERLEPGRLADRLARHFATAAFMTPAVLALLPEERLRGIESLYIGGEACPPDLPLRWGPGRRLYNCYGPTEITVFALTELWDGRSGALPIGRPIGGARAYVVDRGLRQVPVGVSGELLIGGPGLARGYLDRPELTAERFVPDPFGDQPGGRLYRTGDRVRQLADGRFDFLGRIDGQVKLRGIRIETGEVEAVLARHPEVREAAVAVREEPAGKRLVAYVVVPGGEAPDLRRFLADRLPEALVPSAFVRLDALPLTPNGKVDRAALAQMDRTDPGEARAVQGRTEPEGPGERLVADLFREVLRLDVFSLEESFFELGGTSLQAAVLVNLLEQRLGTRVPVVALFLAPSVAELARHLEREHLVEKAWSSVLVPLRSGHPGDGPPLFLIHPVGGNVLCYGDLARHLAGSVFGLQAAGLEEGTEPHQSVEEMADGYLAAIRQAAPGGPYRLAGWSFGGLVALELARRLAEVGERVEELVLIDTPAPGALHLPEPEDADLLAGLAFDLGGLAGVDLEITPASLQGLSPEEGLARVLERAREAGALPPGADTGALRLWRVYRANVHAAEAYRPRPYEGSLMVLAADDNPLLNDFGPSLGWQHLAGSLTAEALPADHYTLLRPPVVERIAESLTPARS